ncbi:arylsulfatase [Maribellus maritimus]|uniref:arylsulfatase n=1 Tax=Maribellus maritimus TaxID=2870838 RepID=UPI001EEAF9C5|nr:arylsulfatase [Maribellus maritimus]MCG6190811.1 arylsulfatase [Maribellus maritimus]
MKKIWIYVVIIAVAIAGIFFLASSLKIKTNNKKLLDSKPNIILILGDDIGYSDIGPFGSEIKTPNLDRLASEGIRFANFYNMSKCEPSRSSLFSGLYEGGKNSVNFAQILKNEGYYVIHSGKEHWMNWAPDHVFAKNIFDQSLTFRAMSEFFVPPSGDFVNPFILNGDTVTYDQIYYEKKPFFKTDVLTDNALRWLEKPVKEEKPFFLFLGYGAAHYPLQARPEDISKYRGTYKSGWDKIRLERFERLKKAGLISENTRLSPPSSNINKFRGHPAGDEERRAEIPMYRPWNSLNEDEKDKLDLEMAVFAAMVDRMDQNIGRVLSYLDEKGIAENTIVIYLSDNGSCPYDSNRDFDYPPGVAEGFRTLCAAWANAGNTPFKYFKQYGHEGGAHTHFIMRWPKNIKAGTITHQTGHIVDVAPTLLEAAGISFPNKIGEISPQPFHGTSLIPILSGKETAEPDFYISGWTERFKMYREKDWKIVKLNGNDWELYNIKQDPTEIDDLADSLPEKVNQLRDNYQAREAELKASTK